MKIVYISGPMAGHHNRNVDAFHEAARMFRSDGHAVVNPAEINANRTDRVDCLIHDIEQLIKCNHIFFLPGWEDSQGALLEHHIAASLRIQMLYHPGAKEVPLPTNNIKAANQLLTNECFAASFHAGWWSDKNGVSLKMNPYTFSNKIALIHSEISEAMEGDRKNSMDEHIPHRPAREVELADALIRIYDLAGAYNLDVAGAMVDKMAYNKTRKDHSKEARAAAGGKAY